MKIDSFSNKKNVFLIFLFIFILLISISSFAKDQPGPYPPVKPPVAIAEADVIQGEAPLEVQFTGKDSYDSDGNITLYYWDFGDNITEILGSETNGTITHTYPAGTYNATLYVLDNDGAVSSDSILISVPCMNLNDLNITGDFNINLNTTLCTETYQLNDTTGNGALTIGNDDITLDCNGARIEFGGGSANSIGVNLAKRDGVTLNDCRFNNFSTSILLSDTNNSLITKNVVTGYSDFYSSPYPKGIVLINSSDNELLDNELNYLYYSINSEGTSSNNIISQNLISNIFGSGIFISTNGTNSEITENSLQGPSIHYAVSYLIGVEIQGTINLLVQNNNVINLDSGIVFYGKSTAEEQVDNLVVNNNTVENMTDQGVGAWGDIESATISNNYILNASGGDSPSGIGIWDSPNVDIYNNIIKNTTTGINLTGDSYGITIYNNYISGAEVSAWDKTYYETGRQNDWNVEKREGPNIIGGPYIGGNYWDDYTGEDTNGDGLGDVGTPYNSDGNIFPGGDSLPLTLMPPVIELIEITPDSAVEGENVTFNATADPGTADSIVVYEWNSSIDEGLSNEKVYATPNLSVGLHNISLRVQSSEGLWSDTEFKTILISPKGNLTFTPSVADFGDVSLGANETMNVTLANTGNDTFENLSVSTNSSLLSASLEENTLFPNESMSVVIELIISQNTTGTGSFTEYLYVSGILQGVNKTSSLSVTYTLPEPDLSVSPQSADLGRVELGSTHEETFTLTNTGNTIISDIQIETNSTALALTQLENVTLESGENTSFTATLSVPAQLTEGSYLEDIIILWDNETTFVPISFSIEIEEPVELRIEPDEWDMGTIPTGQSATQSFKITVIQGDLTGLEGSISVSSDDLLSLDRDSLVLSSGEAEFKAVLSTPSSEGEHAETIRISVSRDDSHVKTENINVIFKTKEDISDLINDAKSRLFEVKSALNDVQAQTTQGSSLYNEIQSNVTAVQQLVDSAESKIGRAEDASPDEAKSLITQANSELAQANGMIRSLDLALNRPQQDFLQRFKYIFLVAGVGVALSAFLVAWREGWIKSGEKETKPLAPKKRQSMKPHPDMFEEELKGKKEPAVPKPKKSETKSEKFRKWQEYYKKHPEEARKWRKYYKMHPEKIKEWEEAYKKHPEEKEKEEGQWYRSYENRRFK